MEVGGGDDHDEHGLMLSLSLRPTGISCSGGGGYAAADHDHVVLNSRSSNYKEEELSPPIIIHPTPANYSNSGSFSSIDHQQYHHHRRQQQQQQQPYSAPAAVAALSIASTSTNISLPHDHQMSLIPPPADQYQEAERHTDQGSRFQLLQSMGTSMVVPNYNHKSSTNMMMRMTHEKNDHQQQHGEEDQEAAAAAVSSPNNSSSVSCLSLNFCTTITTGRKRKSNKLQYSSSSSDQEPEPERSDQHKLDVNHDQNIIIDDDQELDGGKLKKLRLSKDQAAILEERFKENNTLNPKQKIALAKQLNLRPRQVEVWFQNRRARTKLKQTEVDCDLLRRCCENLSEENRRLQREILELRSLRHTQQLYMQHQQQLAPTTLTVCPSCDRRQAMSDAKPASHLISPWRPATAPNNNIIGNQQPINIRSQAKS